MNNQHTIDFRYGPPSSWTNIGLKDDAYKTLVREDGSLLYSFQVRTLSALYFERVYEFSIRAAHGPKKVEQSTESSRFPCVVTKLDYSKASLTLKCFAHSKAGRRTDIVLWEIHLHEDVSEFLTVLTVNIYDHKKSFVARSSAPARIIFAVENQDNRQEGFSASDETPLFEDESLPAPGKVAFLSTPDPLIPTHPDGILRR